MLLAVDSSTQWIGLAVYDGALVRAETFWQTHSHHTVELAQGISDLLERCSVHPADLQVLGTALGPGSFTSLRVGLAVVKGMALGLHIPVVGVPTMDIMAASVPVEPIFHLDEGRKKDRLKKTLKTNVDELAYPVSVLWEDQNSPAGTQLQVNTTAADQEQHLPLGVILQAGRSRFSLGWYHIERGVWQAFGEMELVTIEQLAERVQQPAWIGGELTAADRLVLEKRCPCARLLSPAQSVRRPSYLAEIAWQRWKGGQVENPAAFSPIYIRTAENLGA